MRILALDTATENCSAALLIDGQIHSREERIGRGHAERILPMVDELLRASGTALGELTAIAFGRGPGAFTGVRLAASVTQGLAYAAGVRVIPVSNLRALAQRVLAESAAAERVVVCTDARMREVYWGCFERGPDNLALAVGPERVGPPDSVSLPWERDGGRPHPAGAGTGFSAYPELVVALRQELGVVDGTLLPRAHDIATLALTEASAGRLLDPEQALPTYLRDDIAQPTPHQSLK